MATKFDYGQHVYTPHGSIGQIINLVESEKRYLIQFPNMSACWWFNEADLKEIK